MGGSEPGVYVSAAGGVRVLAWAVGLRLGVWVVLHWLPVFPQERS